MFNSRKFHTLLKPSTIWSIQLKYRYNSQTQIESRNIIRHGINAIFTSPKTADVKIKSTKSQIS